MYQTIFVYKSSNSDHFSETILDIRDAKWYIYIQMPLYSSMGKMNNFVKFSSWRRVLFVGSAIKSLKPFIFFQSIRNTGKTLVVLEKPQKISSFFSSPALRPFYGIFFRASKNFFLLVASPLPLTPPPPPPPPAPK